MFEVPPVARPVQRSTGPGSLDEPGAAVVRSWVAALGATGTTGPSGAAATNGDRVDRIRALEELKGAAAAAQAVLTAELVSSSAAARTAATPAATGRCGPETRSVAAQVALARRESPARGARLVGLARALVDELPETLAALRAGRTSEWRTILVARETACLSTDDRREADAFLGPRLGDWGDRQVEAEARRLAYRMDPAAFTARARSAATNRRVTLRPAPDVMARLAALLPVAQGVAAYAALRREADARRAAGDPRGLGQLMADTLVERVTGQASAVDVPVEVGLVMTDSALLGEHAPVERDGRPLGDPVPAGDRGPGEPRQGQEPAWLTGYGPVPAPVARELVRDTAGEVFLRRVFTRPGSGELVGLESRRRCFEGGLRRLLVLRDQLCRTPWCGAPLRETDHVVPVEAGGRTGEANGQGLCQACNQTKREPGWSARPGSGGAGTAVTTTTPTGDRYTSRPPPLPGRPDRASVASSTPAA
jgi:hypothetical protein